VAITIGPYALWSLWMWSLRFIAVLIAHASFTDKSDDNSVCKLLWNDDMLLW